VPKKKKKKKKKNRYLSLNDSTLELPPPPKKKQKKNTQFRCRNPNEPGVVTVSERKDILHGGVAAAEGSPAGSAAAGKRGGGSSSGASSSGVGNAVSGALREASWFLTGSLSKVTRMARDTTSKMWPDKESGCVCGGKKKKKKKKKKL
jgi:hypothetical protein